MNEKHVKVEVICPEASGKYDFELDLSLTVSEAVSMIADEIRKYEKNKNILSDEKNPDVFCSGLQLPLASDRTLGEYGITCGCRLMIV